MPKVAIRQRMFGGGACSVIYSLVSFSLSLMTLNRRNFEVLRYQPTKKP